MKNGIAKSLALDNIQRLVDETLVDAYASLDSVCHALIRKDDCARDISYMHDRVAHEGLPFLTITLPRLGEWFDKWIRGEEVQRVEGFEPYNGLYPLFLRPFWLGLQPTRERVIRAMPLKGLSHNNSTQEGQSLCDHATATVIRSLRTVLLGLKKLEVSIDPEKRDAMLDKFLQIERDLTEGLPSYVHFSPSIWRAQTVLEDFMQGYVPTCKSPKHGPGAVAGGERGLGKWRKPVLYASLHSQWPYYEYFFGVRSSDGSSESPLSLHFGSPRSLPLHLAYCAREYREMTRVPEPTARLLFVPKDSRGPRIICCEPKELMYIQQGVGAHLVSYIERHPYTKGHVNFADQSVNAELALAASRSREWATLDLSDASDRVSCELIHLLFPERVSKKLFALRSTAVLLPDGRVQPIMKFSPMGSALTFPVESITFWAIAVGCIWECTNDLDLALRSVYVYGDDIIVKVEYFGAVVTGLTDAGLEVNRSKSFTGSDPFRESCGIDAFDGHIVTPSRIKLLPPQRPSDGAAIAAYVKYAENTAAWLPRRSAAMLGLVERLVGRVPRVASPQAFLSIVDPCNFWSHDDYRDLRWDSRLCYYTSVQKCLHTKARREVFPEWNRLQHDLTSRLEGDPTLVVDRSSTQIRKRRLAITYLPWRSEGEVRET